MTVLWAIFLGFIQGATEFLPVSSSGHLAIFQNIFDLKVEGGDMFFDVLLHMGTLIAVFIAFWGDIVSMVRDFFSWLSGLFKKGRRKSPPSVRLILLIIVATLPLIIVLPFKDNIEALSMNLTFVSCALIVTGTLLFISDRFKPGRKNESSARVTDALCVGLMQAVATSPGLSRSGTTIATSLFCGFDRAFAVRFSFLMSIPAVLGANLLELKDAVSSGGLSVSPWVCVAGVLTSAIVGYFAIKFIDMLVKKGKFGVFAYYCWIVGAGVLAYSLFAGK